MASSLLEELEQLRAIVEELTGLRSRWNGTVVVMTTEEMLLVRGRQSFAEKEWSCRITVNSDIVDETIRWRTWIHELLHSVSVGSSEEKYRRLRGWEEVVVESLQRQLRPEILSRLNVTATEELFAIAEAHWPYNPYIAALDELRAYANVEARMFYMNLLQTPLDQRLAYARALSPSQEYLRIFASVCGKLR